MHPPLLNMQVDRVSEHVSSGGWVPLHMAALQEQREIVAMLLHQGAKIDVVDHVSCNSAPSFSICNAVRGHEHCPPPLA